MLVLPSFLEFVLQIENRLCDMTYTQQKIRVGCIIYFDGGPVGVVVSTNVCMYL